MHVHPHPAVFDRFTFVLISAISSVDALMMLGRYDACGRVQDITGWSAPAAAIPVALLAVLSAGLWWYATYSITYRLRRKGHAAALTAYGFCVTLFAAASIAWLGHHSGVRTWVQQTTGWTQMPAKMVLVAGAVAVTALLWHTMSLFTSSGFPDKADPMFGLEFLILVETAMTLSLFLHDVLGNPWWASVALAVVVTLLFWVPWLHVSPGKRCRNSALDA